MARWVAPLLVAFTFSVLIAIGIWQARKHLPSPEEWAKLFENELTAILSVPVEVGSAHVGLTGAIIRDLRIQPEHRSPTGYILTIPELKLRWSWHQIFKPSQWRQIARAQLEQTLRQVIIANASLFLWRDKRGVWNVQPFLTRRPQRRAVRLPALRIENGTLVIGDETLPLPNGMPFQLKLVNVRATTRPVDSGAVAEAEGQIASPLGLENSKASLMIVQVGDEFERGSKSRLIATDIRVSALPQRLRAFKDIRAILTDGIVSKLVLDWQEDVGKVGSRTARRGEAVLSATAKLKETIVRLTGSKAKELRPLNVELSLHLRLENQQVRNWYLTVRTLKTHPQLGEGIVTAEGRRNYWSVRWRGEGFKVETIPLFVPEPSPLRDGFLSGDFAFEAKRKRFRIDAQLAIHQTQFEPVKELKNLSVPTISVPFAETEIHMERIRSRWMGSIEISARTEIGKARAKVWVSGEGGRAKVQLANLRLAPFKHAASTFLPAQMRSFVQLRGGTVSGSFTVSWQGRKWQLEELRGQVYRVALSGEQFPDLKLTGHVQSDGNRFRISEAKVNFDGDAFAFLSGQTTFSETPIWQVQAQISSRAVERLAAWAQAKFKLPINLLRGGKSRVGAGGIGSQWQVQLLWEEPLGAVSFQSLKWRTQLGRMKLLSAPQGAAVLIDETTAKPATSRIAINGAILQLSEGMQLGDFKCLWDGKRKLIIASGSVKVPTIGFGGIVLDDFETDLEIALKVANQLSAELRAVNFGAKLLGGTLSNGQLLMVTDGEKTILNASALSQNIEISQLSRWLEDRRPKMLVEGKFNGEMAISAQFLSQLNWREPEPFSVEGEKRVKRVPDELEDPGRSFPSLRLTLSGKFSDLDANGGEWRMKARELTFSALTIKIGRKRNGWLIRQVAGEGIGRNAFLSANNRGLEVEHFQLKGFANSSSGGWTWDFRLPQVRVCNGALGGWGKGTSKSFEGFLSFSRLDIAQLVKISGLKLRSNSLKGEGAGWLKFSAKGQGGEWRGDWEGAALLTETTWNNWTVEIAGARARGNWLIDEEGELKRLNGKIEGIHLLSDDGQAVLSGSFTLREGSNFLTLNGRWTGVSLRRLSQRLELPVQLQGIAEGTLQILWDGKWRVSGTVESQGIGVGESALWHHVSGEWLWHENEVRLNRFQAKWGDGILTAKGAISTHPKVPANLTASMKNVSLSDLSRLLQEWRLPLSDRQWFGEVDGRIWLSGMKDRLEMTLLLNGRQVQVGLAQLGGVRLDLIVNREFDGKKSLLSSRGVINLRNNGMILTAEFEGGRQRAKIRWRGGNAPISTLQLMAREFRKWEGERKGRALERWLSLPLRGEIWSEGSASLVDGKIVEMEGVVRSPNLRGIGGSIAQANLTVRRSGKLWVVELPELRQDSAVAIGTVTISDDGEIDGELTLKRVPPELVVNSLKLLGEKIEVESMPESLLSAELKIAGTIEKPVIEGTLQADDIYWQGFSIRQILVRRFEFRDGSLKIDKGNGVVKWRTGASLASFWGRQNFNGKRQMFWQFEIPPTSLDALLPINLPLEVERGWLSGSISVQGSWAEPELKGSLRATADALSVAGTDSLPQPFKSLTELYNVHCQIEADGRVAKLTQFVASWANGKINGSGWIELKEKGLQNLFANRGELLVRVENLRTQWKATDLNLLAASFRGQLNRNGLSLIVERAQGNGFAIQGGVLWKGIPRTRWGWLAEGRWDLALKFSDFKWRIDGADGKLSGYLALISQREGEPPDLRGNLILRDGDIVRLPAIGDSVDSEWRFPPASRLALKLEIGDNFFLRNPQASLMLGGEFSLSGDLSQPRLEGELRSQRGTLRLPASVLTITNMSVQIAYAVDRLTRQWMGGARLRIEGETQIDIHRILFTVSGPIDAQSQKLGILPSVTLLAIPPLPEWMMLEKMFGLGLAQLGEALTNWQYLFSGVFVQSFMGNLLAPVTEPIAQALHWTELSVIREQKTGQQWLRFGIPLSPKLHVLWKQGFSSSDPSALEVQYYFGKQTSVTVTKRERERTEIRLQTSVRF